MSKSEAIVSYILSIFWGAVIGGISLYEIAHSNSECFIGYVIGASLIIYGVLGFDVIKNGKDENS
jgi:hypothetical protein